MTFQNNGFEVKVRLQPTVRQINRAPQKLTPAVDCRGSPSARGRTDPPLLSKSDPGGL